MTHPLIGKTLINATLASLTLITLNGIPRIVQGYPIANSETHEAQQHCREHIEEVQASLEEIKILMNHAHSMSAMTPHAMHQHHTEMMSTLSEKIAGVTEMHEHCQEYIGAMPESSQEMLNLIEGDYNMTSMTPEKMKEHHQQMLTTLEQMITDIKTMHEKLDPENHDH